MLLIIKTPQIQCCALLKYPLPKKLVHFKFIVELGLCSLLDSQHCCLPGSYDICPNSATNWGPSISVSEPMGHIFPHLNHCKRQMCVHILENAHTQTVFIAVAKCLRRKGSVLAQDFRGLVHRLRTTTMAAMIRDRGNCSPFVDQKAEAGERRRVQGPVPLVISHLSPTSSFAEPPQIVPPPGTKCSNGRSWETLHV